PRNRARRHTTSRVPAGPAWRSSLSGSGRPSRPWPRLASRAVVRRPVHEGLTPDRRATAPARLALAAVDGQFPVEIPALAVHVDVERVEAGAPGRHRLAHDVG